MHKKLQRFFLVITAVFTILFVFVNPFFDKSLVDIILQEVKLSTFMDTLPHSRKTSGNKKRHPSIIKTENQITSNSIISRNFDFNIIPTNNGKFHLSFYNPYQQDISIKVYDIIGNLVLEEKINMQGKFQKEYDLSKYKTKLFMIEVGNNIYSLTKRINT